MSTHLTIAICTWNRAELLRQTLASLKQMSVPGDLKWEIVLVDNNCTDHTADVIASFDSQLPIRAVVEPQQGHSHSRNRAIQESQGDYILWTDDDVLVDSGWLLAYLAAFERHPSAAFWGGPIEPRFESEPPRWLRENWKRCAGVFAVRSFGDDEFEFTERVLPFGANFAIRGELQRQLLYDARFGRVSDQSVRGYDEIDVLRQLLDAGHRGFSVPAATLKHFIPTSRMTIDYVRRFYEGQGETWVLRGQSQEPVWKLAAQCLGHELGYACHRTFGQTQRWFDHVVKASRAKGQLRKRFVASASRRSSPS